MSTRRIDECERDLIRRAACVLPAGTLGNANHDVIIAKGSGGRVWDVSGNEYVDFLLGSGPMFLGHAHPEVLAAVERQVALGTTFFVNNEPAIRLAEAIAAAVPCAEKVRFVSTGSEADLYAMRLARAFRGREKILKFEGGYHGMSDYSLISLAPKRRANFPEGTADSAGIPEAVRETMLVAPFNDADTASNLIFDHRDELAGVIVEPFQRLLTPKPGFLESLRKVTAELGIPLIFDEVVTGFRFAYGGAQEYYGVIPDVCTLGKIIGGGFPLAAVAGRADIMAHFDRALVGDRGFLPQIGTLSGNPVAAAAGLASLEILKRPGVYERAFAVGRELMAGLGQALDKAGLPAQVVGVPPLFDVIFRRGAVSDYRATLAADEAMHKRFNAALLEAGVLRGDTKFYLSTAHDAACVHDALAAFAVAAGAAARTLEPA